jgi:hypothetical protein
MGELEQYFKQNNKRLIFKWQHYFDVYERHFERFKNKEVVILEIGVSQGGSLQMWKDYFGSKCKIYGVDIDPRCKQFEEENIEIFIGSQSDKKFLQKIKSTIPKIDILIDDGGHTMKQQIVTYEEMYSHVKENGVYLCEDCHTSYWGSYGGGYKRKNSFIEYSKNWIDYLNAYHSRSNRLQVNELTQTAKSVHYYDSIVVIEKGKVEKPFASKTGTPTFDYPKQRPTGFALLTHYATAAFNRISAMLNLPFHIE